jgi:hypothetical protein
MNDMLLNLPWQIQVSLGSGYAAYLLSYRGIRFGHRTIDTTFITLAFGLVATGTMAFMRNQNPIVAGAAAFIATCVLALFWRRFFRDMLGALLRKLNITWANDDPSALATLSGNSRHPISQIAVELDDGTWMRCDHADKYKDTPFGPLTLGPEGDIALYLTHEEKLGQEPKELQTVRHPDWGDLITYIPAARIRQITFRHKR